MSAGATSLADPRPMPMQFRRCGQSECRCRCRVPDSVDLPCGGFWRSRGGGPIAAAAGVWAAVDHRTGSAGIRHSWTRASGRWRRATATPRSRRSAARSPFGRIRWSAHYRRGEAYRRSGGTTRRCGTCARPCDWRPTRRSRWSRSARARDRAAICCKAVDAYERAADKLKAEEPGAALHAGAGALSRRRRGQRARVR